MTAGWVASKYSVLRPFCTAFIKYLAFVQDRVLLSNKATDKMHRSNLSRQWSIHHFRPASGIFPVSPTSLMHSRPSQIQRGRNNWKLQPEITRVQLLISLLPLCSRHLRWHTRPDEPQGTESPPGIFISADPSNNRRLCNEKRREIYLPSQSPGSRSPSCQPFAARPRPPLHCSVLFIQLMYIYSVYLNNPSTEIL